MTRYKLQQSSLKDDVYLNSYRDDIERRLKKIHRAKKRLSNQSRSLKDFASGHLYFGLHKTSGGWVFREWAPNATAIYMIGEFSDWKKDERFALKKGYHGIWQIELEESALSEGMKYYLNVYWHGGSGRRLPSYANRVVQNPDTLIFDAQIWQPKKKYKFKHAAPKNKLPLLVYEAHIGMAQEKESIGTYTEFKENTLPRIVDAGYNTIQLMALAEHPYYGSFGYHVSNFFAPSSRFGTPEELKELIDEAHRLGLRVVMDLVHSHCVRNENEGLARFDGTIYQYFHEGERGIHRLWDSYCFDYGKDEVVHFLLSNCRMWIEEYNIDGFRFDGITSMLYTHHGLSKSFEGYHDYFSEEVDEDAYTYLALANELIHTIKPEAVTIAEDVSGMPGLGACISEGGCGFDYRMAMGITDLWFKLMDLPDEDWNIATLAGELINRRGEEKTISYVECHDQALVGGKTAIFTLAGDAMYYQMHKDSESHIIDRAAALHKMLRLSTAVTSGGGYLNFMGNEFGHPEWIDFPRMGNNWSYHYARRQWQLLDNPELRYHYLADFDKQITSLLSGNDIISYEPKILYVNNDDKVMAFERGGFFFFFNFHPSRSFTDYGIAALPGKYKLILDTDSEAFGGFERLTPDQTYSTIAQQTEYEIVDLLMLYLPSRCGLVLKRQSSNDTKD